jgi:hypothetical protein
VLAWVLVFADVAAVQMFACFKLRIVSCAHQVQLGPVHCGSSVLCLGEHAKSKSMLANVWWALRGICCCCSTCRHQ